MGYHVMLIFKVPNYFYIRCIKLNIRVAPLTLVFINQVANQKVLVYNSEMVTAPREPARGNKRNLVTGVCVLNGCQSTLVYDIGHETRSAAIWQVILSKIMSLVISV